MKRLMKILSLMLCIVMVISSLPISALAASKKDVKEEKTETVTVSELKDKRDIYSKTYETSKGTNVIVSSAVPLHYEKDGKLVEIDNTLVKSQKDDAILTNKSNSFNVELPKSLNTDSEISLNDEVSFKLVNENITKAKGVISKNEETKSDVTNSENAAYKESNIDSLSSSIEYKNVLDKTDLEYTISNNQLKESIIVNELPSEDYSISYELNIGKLKAELNKDNSITIFNKKDEPEYIIEKPYMFDSGENESEDITVSLTEQEGTFLLTYVPNFEWLSNENIKYPITIDPTVTVAGRLANNTENIEDTYIYSSGLNKSKSFYDKNFIMVQHTNTKDAWGCLNINNLPQLPANTQILNSSLNLYSLNDMNTKYYVELLEAPNYNIQNTPFSSLTWNVGISVANSPMDIADIPIEGGVVSFDITKLISDNYNGTSSSRTLVLRSKESNASDIRFASNSNGTSGYRPYMTIEYEPEKIHTNYFSQDLGFAGTASVDDYTGELYIERTDISANSDIGDVTFYMGNNTNYPETECFGEKTSINYYETITKQLINNDATYIVKSGSGKTTIVQSGNDGWIVDDNNNIITLSHTSNNQKNESTYTNKGGTFYLTSLKDYHKNEDNSYTIDKEISITYIYHSNTNDYRLNTISDDLMHLSFIYSQGKISTLTLEANEHSCIEDYADNHYNELTSAEVTYEFDESSLVVENDSAIVSYEQTSDNELTITNEFEGSFEYTFDSLNRVETVQEFSNQHDDGDCLTFTYGNNTTTVSDGTNTYTEFFDNSGNVKTVLDQNGNAVFAQYEGNKLIKLSNSRNSRRNFVDFYGFEENTSEDNLFMNSNGTHSLSTNEKLFGNSSLQLSSTANSNSLFEGSINNLKPHTTYTLSMWIKADDNINCDVFIDNYSKSSQVQSYQIDSTYHSPIFAINNNWQQIYCTLSTSDDSFNKFDISLVTRNSTSGNISVFIDNLYLQQSSYLTNLNLLSNGDFSTTPTQWNIKKTNDLGSTVESRAGVETDIETRDNNETSTIDPRRFKNTGAYNQNAELYQTVTLTASEGTKYSYGAWIKAINTLPFSSNDNRKISLQVYETNSDESNIESLGETIITQEYDGWQYVEGEVSLTHDLGTNCDFDRLKFVVNFNHQTGTIYVDAATLSVGPLYSTEFKYNTKNKIISVIKNGKQTELDSEEVDTGTIVYNTSNNKIVIKTNNEEYGNNINRAINNANKYINSSPLMLQQIDSVRNVTDYLFDGLGNSASVVDSNGREIEYGYDQLANLISTVDSFYSPNTNDPAQSDLLISGLDNYVKYHAVDSFDSSQINQLAQNNGITDEQYAEYLLNNNNNLQGEYNELNAYYNTLDKTSISITYTYLGHRLEKIETTSDCQDSPVSVYSFKYDDWNNLVGIYINDENETNPFIQYNYDNTNYRQLNSVEFANGQIINYNYDSDGNIIYEYDSSNQNGSSLAYSYYYYEDGTCYGKKDVINGITESYQDGSCTVCDNNNNVIQAYCYDSQDNLIELLNSNTINVSKPTDVSETDDIKLEKVVSNVNNTDYSVFRTYDKLNRVESEEFYTGNIRNANYPHLLKEYHYYGNGDDNGDEEPSSQSQTVIASSHTLKSVEYYLLDAQNNKTDLQCSKYNRYHDNSITTNSKLSSWSNNTGTDINGPNSYFYNSGNMLLRSITHGFDIIKDYSYNPLGNIRSIKFSEGAGTDLLNVQATEEQSLLEFIYDEQYSGEGINNLLTSSNLYDVQILTDPNNNTTTRTQTLNKTKSFSYDEMGNTTQVVETDNNNHQNTTEFNWVRGNILGDMSIGNNDIEFSYDDNDLRTAKEVIQNNNSVRKTEYYWNGNKLSGQRMNFAVNNTQKYYDVIILYDDSGNSYGFVLNEYSNNTYNTILNSETFYYIKDAENTIDAIVDTSGDIVISFDYDDYGVPTVDYDSTSDEYVLLANPLVYRDYIYDQESGLYYLQARYYDPQMCRYINASSKLDSGNGTIMSTNLFAYCENNPINNCAPYGYMKKRWNNKVLHSSFKTIDYNFEF